MKTDWDEVMFRFAMLCAGSLVSALLVIPAVQGFTEGDWHIAIGVYGTLLFFGVAFTAAYVSMRWWR